jgi:glycosyltransferase involved in cell wall biosynthesis
LIKIIVVLPIHNEEKTLADILARIDPQADLIVCVNDGSRDQSGEILNRFARKRRNTYIVELPANQGMAGALKAGFLFTLYLTRKGIAKEEDVVVTIDADGQHKPEYIRPIVRYLIRKKADVVLTRRNFSAYPRYKVWGNRFLTWTNSLLSGKKYRDVESGLRFLKVKTLKNILRYYTGVKYSCAQEIALISARSGFIIDNNFQVDIAYYRPGTTVWDGFIVLFFSWMAFVRCVFRIASKLETDTPLMDITFSRSRRLWSGTRKSHRLKR